MPSATVESLHVYPLTGARAQNVDSAQIAMDGSFVDDRVFALGDSAAEGAYGRVSLKAHDKKLYPQLTGVEAKLSPDLAQFSYRDEHGLRVLEVEKAAILGSTLVRLNEFGDTIPVFDLGDLPARFFAAILDRPNTRLTQKIPDYYALRAGPPSEWKPIAPIHLVFGDAVSLVANGSDINQTRFRPNLVVQGMPSVDGEPLNPRHENMLIGKKLRIGSAIAKIIRPTVRCVVTTFDPDTGENRRDTLALLRDNWQKYEYEGRLETVFGLYCAFEPYDINGEQVVSVSRGNEVELYDVAA